MSLIGLTESVRGDPRRFEVWLQGRAEVHTFQAATVEIKGKWVTEIKKVLMNQLEELKDEKIKQYGNANHRWEDLILDFVNLMKNFPEHRQTVEAIKFCIVWRPIDIRPTQHSSDERRSWRCQAKRDATEWRRNSHVELDRH